MKVDMKLILLNIELYFSMLELKDAFYFNQAKKGKIIKNSLLNIKY
jgi:hypothetical protein